MDPLKMESPHAEPVDTANLKVYNAQVEIMMVKLDSLKGTSKNCDLIKI